MLRGRDRWRAGFPHAQLLFCVACLSMAAYMWMRYSYCWQMERVQLSRGRRLFEPDAGQWPDLAYGEVRGVPTVWCTSDGDDDWEVFLVDPSEAIPASPPAGGPARSRRREPGAGASMASAAGGSRGTSGVVASTLVRGGGPRPEACSDGAWRLRGRYHLLPGHWTASGQTCLVDADASRFHPGTVAGLVVGAMGCLIFGLYLRAWLVEKRALAGEPVRDMMA